MKLIAWLEREDEGQERKALVEMSASELRAATGHDLTALKPSDRITLPVFADLLNQVRRVAGRLNEELERIG